METLLLTKGSASHIHDPTVASNAEKKTKWLFQETLLVQHFHADNNGQ
jgi:hypothetical protein